MQLAAAALTLVAAVALTYFFCVRPMRNGSHCAVSPPGPSQQADQAHQTGSGVAPAQVQAAREELAALRAQAAHQTDPAAVDDEGGRPSPPRRGRSVAEVYPTLFTIFGVSCPATAPARRWPARRGADLWRASVVTRRSL